MFKQKKEGVKILTDMHTYCGNMSFKKVFGMLPSGCLKATLYFIILYTYLFFFILCLNKKKNRILGLEE